MNAGLRTLEINVQDFNDDLSRAAMATDSLVAADSTWIRARRNRREERDENHADGHSYRVQLLSDPEDTASEGSQIDNDDDDDADWNIIEANQVDDNRTGRYNRTAI
jgi:hypothetical protein